jgi:hypothetical protein
MNSPENSKDKKLPLRWLTTKLPQFALTLLCSDRTTPLLSEPSLWENKRTARQAMLLDSLIEAKLKRKASEPP